MCKLNTPEESFGLLHSLLKASSFFNLLLLGTITIPYPVLSGFCKTSIYYKIIFNNKMPIFLLLRSLKGLFASFSDVIQVEHILEQYLAHNSYSINICWIKKRRDNQKGKVAKRSVK